MFLFDCLWEMRRQSLIALLHLNTWSINEKKKMKIKRWKRGERSWWWWRRRLSYFNNTHTHTHTPGWQRGGENSRLACAFFKKKNRKEKKRRGSSEFFKVPFCYISFFFKVSLKVEGSRPRPGDVGKNWKHQVKNNKELTSLTRLFSLFLQKRGNNLSDGITFSA